MSIWSLVNRKALSRYKGVFIGIIISQEQKPTQNSSRKMGFTGWMCGYLMEFGHQHTLRAWTQESESEKPKLCNLIEIHGLSSFLLSCLIHSSLLWELACFASTGISWKRWLAQSQTDESPQLFYCNSKFLGKTVLVWTRRVPLTKEAGSCVQTWPPFQQGLSVGWHPRLSVN